MSSVERIDGTKMNDTHRKSWRMRRMKAGMSAVGPLGVVAVLVLMFRFLPASGVNAF